MSAFLAILTALLSVIGAGFVFARPFWAFLPVALLFAMEQLLQSYFPILQTHSSAVNIAVILLAGLAVLLRFARGDGIAAGLRNPVTLLIYLQFGLWLLGMLYTSEEAPLSVRFQTVWHFAVLVMVVAPLLVISLEEFRRILIGFMTVGSIIALLILLNPNTAYYSGRLVIDLGMMDVHDNSIGNPLATATLGATVALIAALIVPARRSALTNVLRAGAFALGLGLAIGSGSRGQVLAMGVAGLMFFPLARRLNNPRNFIFTSIGLLAVAGGAFVTFQLFIGDQNRQRWDIGQMFEDITLRFDMCWTYIDAYLASPGHWLFGLGTNAWVGIGAPQYDVDYVHNIAVEILCEQGLVGAAIFTLTTVLVIRMGFRLWSLHKQDPALRSVSAILLAICAFELFNALKQGSITSCAPFGWWLMLAKVSTREQREAALVALPPVDDVDWGFESGEYDVAMARS